MPSPNLRNARRPILAEALESRTLFDATPIFLEQLISTGKHAKFQESTLDGIPFGVTVKQGTVNVYKLDNRIELNVTNTDATTTIAIRGHVQFADVVINGPMKSFMTANNTVLTGTMAVAGSVDKLTMGGISGTLAIRGSLGTGKIGGLSGTLAVGGAITKLTTGALNNATILSGAILPADSPIAAVNNTYAPGAIGQLNINGPMINSNVAVGVSAGANNVFGDSDDTSAGGGLIAKITLSQGADANSHIEAGSFGTVRTKPYATVAPVKKLTNPLSDSHFVIPPAAPTGPVGTVSAYANAVLADLPEAYYRLGESTGADVVDSSGNGHNGTYINGPTLGQPGALVGDPNTAVEFGGAGSTSSYADVGNVGDFTSGDFTIEFWVKPTSLANAPVVFSKGLASVAGYFCQINQSGNISLTVNQAGNSQSYGFGGTVALNAWTCVQIVRSGLALSCYENGALLSQQTITVDPATSPRDFFISNYDGSSYSLDGEMDEFAIYSTALSVGRLAAHYDAGITAPTT